MTMKFLNVAAVLGGMLACMAPAWAQQANPFPDGPGREIVAVACTQCHAAQAIVQLRMNDVGWRRQVYNMILRGAQIGPNDIDATVKYLSTAFGPGVPLPFPTKGHITLADGTAKPLVEGGCAMCHGLDRVVAARRPGDQWQAIVNRMVSVGAPLAPDQASEIVAYLKANYAAPVVN
jgi:mono/diheme cytochrome c family protein